MKNLIICKNCGRDLVVEEIVREYNGLDSCYILIVEPCDCWRIKSKKPITITPPRYDDVFFDGSNCVEPYRAKARKNTQPKYPPPPPDQTIFIF